MNLVSRKMVIKELKDRFLVRRKYGSGQFGEAVFAAESSLCGSIRRAMNCTPNVGHNLTSEGAVYET
ncbi:hypothetical protein, partial [Escherichia coli]|uniref:hypothetical protein n=1 Tax=Escherichia coli TaxID=562 RepID=UPI001BC8BB49